MIRSLKAALLSCIFVTLAAATSRSTEFQNLGFEEYPGGPTLPHWELVMKSGTGELLYKGFEPGNIGDGYPFVGAHIGGGPVITVTSNGSPFGDYHLEGDHALLLTTYRDGPFFQTVAQAQAAIDTIPLGGVAQTSTVPSWAKSFWIAAPNIEGVPAITFSGHQLQVGTPTFEQSYAMFQQAGIEMPAGLGGPGPFPGTPTWRHYAGNIESISGITRELMLLPERPVPSAYGNGAGYYTSSPRAAFDMIMFSPQPWDGPAVNVPEPAAVLLILPAIAALRRRHHHA